MPIKFRCPKCNQAYSISSKKAGTSLTCQKCDAKMRIPAIEPKENSTRVSEPAAEQRASGAVVDDQPDLASAIRNLLDDDVQKEDVFVDLSTDEVQDSAAAVDAVSNVASGAIVNSSGPVDTDDDLAAVLAFEDAIDEEEGPATGRLAPLPDELFSEEDEEEDGAWGGGRTVDDEEMDLTPMVDVTFLLLIFFMITASFSIQKTLEVPPPNPDEKGASQSQTIKDIEEQSVLVYIDSRNVISVDDEPLSDPGRLADIMRSKRMSEVLITAHENSMHDMLVKVIDAANEIGMQKIRVGVTKGSD